MSDHSHDSKAGPADEKPDTSPPRNQLMLIILLSSVTTLFGLKFVFDSYLDREVDETRSGHIAASDSTDALAAYRAEAAARLAGGAMPIEDAIEQLGTRGRAAFVQIRPAPGDIDRAAHEGWSSLAVAAPAAAPTPTRSAFTLNAEHMPPPDPEADALEAAADLTVLGAPL